MSVLTYTLGFLGTQTEPSTFFLSCIISNDKVSNNRVGRCIDHINKPGENFKGIPYLTIFFS